MSDNIAKNTDRELWREDDDESGYDFNQYLDGPAE